MASTYLESVLRRVKEILKGKDTPAKDEFEAALRQARAEAGGRAKAEKAKAGAEPDEVAAVDIAALADGPSWEERMGAISRALEARYGQFIAIVATYDGYVIASEYGSDAPPKLWRQDFTLGADGAVELGDRVPVREVRDYAEVAAADSSDALSTTVALRLSDGSGLPEWQQLHKVGEWAVPHGSGIKVQLSREMGDQMIANFRSGVIRRGVPLDEGHATDDGGHALGWLCDMRWGREGEGLPGQPEPGGVGEILYGRFRYNTLGTQKLGDEQFRYISPQYALDYVDKETGRSYGPALTAVAATNNPFLRIRSIQGEPAPEPVVLSDGLRAGGDSTAVVEATEMPIDEAKLTELEQRNVALAEQVARLQAERHSERVESIKREYAAKGVAPALLNKVSRIMLACDPGAQPVVKLSDDAEAQPVNLFSAFEALLADLPAVDLHARTQQTDSRPASAKLDDQFVKGSIDEALAVVGHKRNGASA